MLELDRSDLWEIYFALSKRAGHYLNVKLDALESYDFDGAKIADLRLDALKRAEDKIWAEIDKGF